MNSNAKPSFYFSAYPLTAIKNSSGKKEPGSPYLRAVLSGKTKTSSRVRVFPITYPHTKQFKPAPFDIEKLPKDIELTERDWFNNYE